MSRMKGIIHVNMIKKIPAAKKIIKEQKKLKKELLYITKTRNKLPEKIINESSRNTYTCIYIYWFI